MIVATTDPIADMLTRIRNAILVRKPEVSLPHSKAKQAVAELLQSTGFVQSVRVIDAQIGKTLVITINGPSEPARITEITRLSKPGRRMYVAAGEIPVVKSGRGIVIISTSKGVMSGNDAKKHHVGGELICKVY